MPTDLTLKIDPRYLPSEADARDESLEQLAIVAKYASDCGEFSDAVREAGAAILACRNLSWDAADEIEQRISYMRVSLDQAADAAGKLAPGGLEGREAARQNVFRTRRRELVEGLNVELAAQGSTLAKRAVEALQALDSKIGIAKARWTYSELGPTRPLDEAMQIHRFSEQAKARGIEQLFEVYTALKTAGDTDAMMKIEGCESWIRELLAESMSTKVAKLTHGLTKQVRPNDQIAKERRLCEAMLREFEMQRAARVPPELTLTAMLRTDCLQPAFMRIVGKSAYDLPVVEFNSVVAGSGRVPDPLTILENWWSRNIPEARSDSRTVNARTLEMRGGDRGPPAWRPLSERTAANRVGNRVGNDRSVVRGR
jgi:hypothetical protein